MAAKTNNGLVAYAKAQLGKPYWYGTFGQEGTNTLLTQKQRQYSSMYTKERVANCRKQYGEKVHDCVGLIKAYLWCDSASDKTPRYNANQDKSANGMYNVCKERGSINTMPELAGVLVFMDGHIGVYIGNGEVIEAKGFAYGVVKTKLAGRGWTRWGKCPYITYETAASKPTTNTAAKKSVDVIAQEVLAGKWGNGEDRRKRLAAAGYNADEVQAKVNAIIKSASSNKKSATVGAKVKITKNYASSSVSKSAGNKRAIGTTAYIVKIYEGKAFPYQLGSKKGDTSSANTIGFAKATAFELV